MLHLNRVSLVGRLGRDPEIRWFENGNCVVNFAIAVNRPSKDEPADWFDISLWNKTAEVASNYAKKGSLVGIEGVYSMETWVDKTTGANRSKPVINGDRLTLLGSKSDGGSGGPVFVPDEF